MCNQIIQKILTWTASLGPLKISIGSCTDLNVDSGPSSGSNLKYWLRLRLQPKIQTPAGVHSSTPAAWSSLTHTAQQRWARIRTGSDWIRTDANISGTGLDRTASFFQNWRIRTGSDSENFCCFHVIILKISKILVVIQFHRFAKW